MMKKIFLSLYFFCNFLVATAHAGGVGVTSQRPHDESVGIATKTIMRPVSDLVDTNGELLDVSDIVRLQKQGKDISLLNPTDNRLYRSVPARLDDFKEIKFIEYDRGIKFDSHEALPLFTYMARVQALGKPQTSLRFAMSRYTQPVLMRAHLLRKIGYYAPIPKYFPRMKINFSSVAQMESFVLRAARVSDLAESKWLIERNDKEKYIIMKSVTIEEATTDVFDAHWGLAPSPKNENNRPELDRYSRMRAWRALLIPFTLVDVPESINRFSSKCGKWNGSVFTINHPFAESFQGVTKEDVRWVLARLAKLNNEDWREIVAAAQYPEAPAQLVYAKLMHRLDCFNKAFDIKPQQPLELPALEFSSVDRTVVEGKLLQCEWPDHPQRFCHGDRESPYKDGDTLRYFGIELRSSKIKEGLARLNDKIAFRTTEDAAKKRALEISNRIREHIRTKPLEPLYQEREWWGGTTFGISGDAQRTLSTGTYYESSAPLQLVDNLSVAASLGYFSTMEGLKYVRPFVGGNVSIVRSYTHVRPVDSVKKAQDVEWFKNLFGMPLVIKDLGRILNNEDERKEDEPIEPIDRFFAKFAEGEVFSISDSIVGGFYGRFNAALDVLLGINPLNFLNAISAGFDTTALVLDQTIIMRTKEGLQIRIVDQNSLIGGVQADGNFFLNVWKIRGQRMDSDIKTKAYVLDYNADFNVLAEQKGPTSQSEKEAEKNKEIKKTQEDIAQSLYGLMVNNSSAILQDKFKESMIPIKHKLVTDELTSKFLLFKGINYNETHRLSFTPPPSAKHPDLDPAAEEVEVFANRQGELEGRDLLGMLLDVADGFLQKWGVKGGGLSRDQNPNPANMPLGRAKWRHIEAEVDLTKSKKPFPPVAQVQRVWGGWSLKKADFLKLIDEIEGEYRGSGLIKGDLIDRGEFVTVKSIDFYRISANLSILSGGIKKVRDLLLQPQIKSGPPKPAQLLGHILRIFKGRDTRVENDREMFRQFMILIGDNDEVRGQQQFSLACQNEYRFKNLDSGGGFPPTEWRYGNSYECLTDWLRQILVLANNFPEKKEDQANWLADTLAVLDKHIPQPLLLKYLEDKNYLFAIRINGFRSGDEDGDLETFSHGLGTPEEEFPEAGGIMNRYAVEMRVSPFEFRRTQVSAR